MLARIPRFLLLDMQKIILHLLIVFAAVGCASSPDVRLSGSDPQWLEKFKTSRGP